jgi:adenosylcobinamide kinase / adenosylcobinamide-phosphate guanylyltransferase
MIVACKLQSFSKPLNMKTLVLGGARSGKSHYAQKLAEETGKRVVYIATATAGDNEMKLRIEQHQRQRPASWSIVEEPLKLSKAIIQNADNKHCILVDCLTLWLSNVMAEKNISEVEQQIDELVETVSKVNTDLIMVSNEVGQGVVPLGELSRQFVDESGRMHQKLAQVCEGVVFTIAGLPQILK